MVVSLLAPVHILLICCFTFIIINFICKVLVSLKKYICSEAGKYTFTVSLNITARDGYYYNIILTDFGTTSVIPVTY